jgi:hypothetical protein
MSLSDVRPTGVDGDPSIARDGPGIGTGAINSNESAKFGRAYRTRVCLRTEIGQERRYRDGQKRAYAATANRRRRANIEKVDPGSDIQPPIKWREYCTSCAYHLAPRVEPPGRIMRRTKVA